MHGRLKKTSLETDGEDTFQDSPGVERVDTSTFLGGNGFGCLSGVPFNIGLFAFH